VNGLPAAHSFRSGRVERVAQEEGKHGCEAQVPGVIGLRALIASDDTCAAEAALREFL
jgi:hypothetical protein